MNIYNNGGKVPDCFVQLLLLVKETCINGFDFLIPKIFSILITNLMNKLYRDTTTHTESKKGIKPEKEIYILSKRDQSNVAKHRDDFIGFYFMIFA